MEVIFEEDYKVGSAYFSLSAILLASSAPSASERNRGPPIPLSSMPEGVLRRLARSMGDIGN